MFVRLSFFSRFSRSLLSCITQTIWPNETLESKHIQLNLWPDLLYATDFYCTSTVICRCWLSAKLKADVKSFITHLSYLADWWLWTEWHLSVSREGRYDIFQDYCPLASYTLILFQVTCAASEQLLIFGLKHAHLKYKVQMQLKSIFRSVELAIH